jgi:hypothetical protein
MSRSRRVKAVLLFVFAVSNLVRADMPAAEDEHADRFNPNDGPVSQSSDSPEAKDAPSHFFGPSPVQDAFGNTASSAQQQRGALSGKIVYMNSGHGWTHDTNFTPPWRLQRGTLNLMNEDYGNLDQLNFFATYCFNAGATVVSMRPLGHQTNEIILDNDSAGVTFAGSWSDSVGSPYWGAAADAVHYRFATLAATETATATYTPAIPVTGNYPVYCWVRYGSDRGDQLYRIRHTGGETQIRIPHHMVGNGWVYLGEYYFNSGANAALGSVVISNLRGTPAGTVVIADAIRFGNGMGSVDQGGGVSGYPREDENMRYWVRANLGQGQSSSLYNGSGDDESDSWSAPGKMSAEMNREQAGTTNDRIHISFHSNAGGGRGAVGLITGTPTQNQALLAQLCGQEVNVNLRALNSQLEYPWSTRTTYTYTGGYGEITRTYFESEMDATIVEVAYHDDVMDAALMRDSRVRSAIARSTLHAVIKFLNQVSASSPPPLAFLPEPPTNVRALAAGTNGNITLSWAAPVNLIGSQNPTNYIIYRSTNGYGFGNPISVGNVTSFTVSNLPPNTEFYFRISAVNAGGESMPSEVAGCRVAPTNGAPKVLVVNGFDRFDRTTNLRHNTARGSWDPPSNSGTIERVFQRWINSFDYIVQHGKAIASYGMAFDSCQNEAIINNQVSLSSYPIAIWACGNETVAGETFNSTEQTKITAYLAAGGNLFVSGADVANDLDRVSGPTASDRSFLHNQLHAAFTNDDSTSYTAVPQAGGIFAGRSNGTIDNGNFGIYWVQTPDVLGPYGPGAVAALNYSSGTGGGAAIQYDGSAGGGRTVLFGFPFETIRDATRRNQYMSDILTFLSLPPGTNLGPVILTPPQGQFVVVGSNATFSVVASGTPPLAYQWQFNGSNIVGATQSTYTRSAAQFNHSGNYSVVVSNAFDDVTSQNALLQVMFPPVQTLFSDNFDVNTAANWVTNRSSSDCRVAFNYDYSPYGIPSAPNSTNGTTRGVKFEANVSLGVAAAINISPVGQNFGGDYRLHFDLWINANGPFPAGGAGSTQHGTAGVGTAGNRIQWSGAGNADGVWFGADGEGQATDATPDFRAQIGASLQASNSGVYAAGIGPSARLCSNPYYTAKFPGGQTAPAAQGQSGSLAAGTIGFLWRDVIISKTGNTIEWFIDGLKIATITNTLTSSNIFIGYYDTFNSLSSNTNLSFGMFDNVRVERLVTNVPPYLTSQPQSLSVAQGSNAVFNVTAGGTATLGYQWRFGGTNIAGATQSSYTRSNAQTNDAGNYTVLVTNAYGSVTSSIATLTVLLPPVITNQPESQTVKDGTNATFSVVATSVAPLSYQWQFNGGDINGATDSSFSIAHVTAFDAGNYTVSIANVAGEVTSSNAVLTVIPPAPPVFSDLTVLGNQIQLTIGAEPGIDVIVLRSEDLTNWDVITNLPNPTGTIQFAEPIALDIPQRFYRAQLSP